MKFNDLSVGDFFRFDNSDDKSVWIVTTGDISSVNLLNGVGTWLGWDDDKNPAVTKVSKDDLLSWIADNITAN